MISTGHMRLITTLARTFWLIDLFFSMRDHRAVF
jgi:hypothetical protein